ncbi:MAG: hypothetical protein WCR42_00835 [bacterium]
MKTFILLIIFCFAFVLQANAQNSPKIIFQMKAGNTRTYNLSDIDNIKLTNCSADMMMNIHSKKTLLDSYPTNSIKSILFGLNSQNQKILTMVYSDTKINTIKYILAEIDSIVFKQEAQPIDFFPFEVGSGWVYSYTDSIFGIYSTGKFSISTDGLWFCSILDNLPWYGRKAAIFHVVKFNVEDGVNEKLNINNIYLSQDATGLYSWQSPDAGWKKVISFTEASWKDYSFLFTSGLYSNTTKLSTGTITVPAGSFNTIQTGYSYSNYSDHYATTYRSESPFECYADKVGLVYAQRSYSENPQDPNDTDLSDKEKVSLVAMGQFSLIESEPNEYPNFDQIPSEICMIEGSANSKDASSQDGQGNPLQDWYGFKILGGYKMVLRCWYQGGCATDPGYVEVSLWEYDANNKLIFIDKAKTFVEKDCIKQAGLLADLKANTKYFIGVRAINDKNNNQRSYQIFIGHQ